MDGIAGPLIIRQPIETDPQRNQYDFDLPEHVMIIQDWSSDEGVEKFGAYYLADKYIETSTILINGLGRFKHFVAPNNETFYTPTARFMVDKVSFSFNYAIKQF